MQAEKSLIPFFRTVSNGSGRVVFPNLIDQRSFDWETPNPELA